PVEDEVRVCERLLLAGARRGLDRPLQQVDTLEPPPLRLTDLAVGRDQARVLLRGRRVGPTLEQLHAAAQPAERLRVAPAALLEHRVLEVEAPEGDLIRREQATGGAVCDRSLLILAGALTQIAQRLQRL